MPKQNDHIYVFYFEDSLNTIYQIGNFLLPREGLCYEEVKLKHKVRAMAVHGTCLYILHDTTIEVYDTAEECVQAEWPKQGFKLQTILKESKYKRVFLLNVAGSSLCLHVDGEKKECFYFIKPVWPAMLPQLDISGKFINTLKKKQ